MSFEDDLRSEFEAEKPSVDVPVKLGGQLHTLRFFRMDPDEWVRACDMFPARPGVAMDMRWGYNLRDLTPLVAAKTGKRVDGDTLVDLTTEQWANLFRVLPGGLQGKIGDAVFALNELDPLEDIAAAKKALEAALALSSGSLLGSASPADDSADGSPAS